MKNTATAIATTATLTENLLGKKIWTSLQLLCIYIIPPISIRMGYIPNTNKTNAIVLGVCTFACLFITWLEEGWNWKKYWDNKVSKKIFISYALLTFFGLLFLLCVKEICGFKFSEKFLYTEHYKYLLPLCLAQTFSYRVFLPRKLEVFTASKRKLLFLNTSFFTLMHVMFNPVFIGVCAIGGFAFSWVYTYKKQENSTLMTGSHSILNFTAGFIGAFSGIN
jgi:membrane protease YdiL (CAAX protease family)